jgi:hypothetical protein
MVLGLGMAITIPCQVFRFDVSLSVCDRIIVATC